MRYDHDIGAHIARPTPHDLALDDLVDIGHQQRRTLPGLDAQDAARVVAQIRKITRWMQESETYAVPLPRRTGKTRSAVRQRGGAFGRQRQSGWEDTCNRGKSAGMVIVAMADDGHVEPEYAECMQRRDAHALARIESIRYGRAHVVKQVVMRRAHQHRQALANIKHDELSLPLSWQCPIRP